MVGAAGAAATTLAAVIAPAETTDDVVPGVLGAGGAGAVLAPAEAADDVDGQRFILPDESVLVTGGASAAFVNDAIRLAAAFTETAQPGMRLLSTTVLKHGPLADRYDALVAAMKTKQIPLLTPGRPAHRSRGEKLATVSARGPLRQVLAFHGTNEDNIPNIIEQGFLIGQGTPLTFGPAIYTACSSAYSNKYVTAYLNQYVSDSDAPETVSMIGCRLLVHEDEIRDDMHAIIHSARVLPICILRYLRR